MPYARQECGSVASGHGAAVVVEAAGKEEVDVV
jgi:hypothetical protein